MYNKHVLAFFLLGISWILFNTNAIAQENNAQTSFETETAESIESAIEDVKSAIAQPLPPFKRAELAHKWSICPIHMQALDSVAKNLHPLDKNYNENVERLLAIIDNLEPDQKGPKWITLSKHCIPTKCAQSKTLQNNLQEFPDAYVYILNNWLTHPNINKLTPTYFELLAQLETHAPHLAADYWPPIITATQEDIWKKYLKGSDAFRTKVAIRLLENWLNDPTPMDNDATLRRMKALTLLPPINTSILTSEENKNWIQTTRQTLIPKILERLEDKTISTRILAIHLVQAQEFQELLPNIEKIFLEAKNPTERAAALQTLAGLHHPNVKNLLKSALENKEATLRLEAANIIQHMKELNEEDIQFVKTALANEIWSEISTPLLQKLLECSFIDKESFIKTVIFNETLDNKTRSANIKLAYSGGGNPDIALKATLEDLQIAEKTNLPNEALYHIAANLLQHQTNNDILVETYAWVTQQDDDSYHFLQLLGFAFQNAKKLKPFDYKAFLQNVCQTENNLLLPICLEELSKFSEDKDVQILYDKIKDASLNDEQNAATEDIFSHP